MEPVPGFYEKVVVLDFKSLYPSIIRSFFVDPLGMVIESGKQREDGETLILPTGHRFSRGHNLLPSILSELTGEREKAKKEGNKSLSQVLKIIMNSFYGVLGSPFCRFFDPRLATAITEMGQWILKETMEFLKTLGYKVIYGDTDSIFIHLVGVPEPEQTARTLIEKINRHWNDRLYRDYQLESFLELEFDVFYNKFFLPALRGSDTGSKKKYAGLVFDSGRPEIQFTGMEQVRRDWTVLAKNFQKDLLMAIFLGEDFKNLIRERVSLLKRGELDADLIYKKALNKNLKEYAILPPHAVAAGKMKVITHHVIHYVMTPGGPEPTCNHPTSLDYDHYYEKQLKPVGDGILQFFDTSVDEITRPEKQLSLF